ncbi:WecB/TagA/CpsF family glycosyltransferase [Caenispirillum salinarum]|uniref:WecB/TagA/CpsF family glycosyltransferase n=1 Tax=Caenispirillum salinarum TaxID=859058 RepID=UPI00384FEA0A
MGDMGKTPGLDILGTTVHALTLDEAARRMVATAVGRRPLTVCPRDAHGIIRARSDTGLRRAHDRADLVTADGMPLVWLQRLAGFREAERVYGPDLMDRVCDLGRNQGLRHVILGGRPGIAARVAAELEARHPRVRIACAAGLPMRPPGRLPQAGEDLETLRGVEADVLWLGLGSPRQELWLDANRAALEIPVRAGVGAAFDFIAGTVPQAPHPFRAAGLEWLWRLAVEPRRLGPRYARTVPVFLLLCARHRPWRRRTA